MKITDVAIQLAAQGQDRLRGFCCITLDGCFVVRDIKIINGSPNGLPSPCLRERLWEAARAAAPRTTCMPASAINAGPRCRP